jgi:hypothetical protein
MWFPSRKIFLEIVIEHKFKKTHSLPNIWCRDSQDIIPTQKIKDNLQIIQFNVDIPEVLYLDLNDNSNSVLTSIKIDGISINQNKLNEVFKFIPNQKNLPFNINVVKKLPSKNTCQLIGKSFLVFDIFESNAIAYLLSIGNKIELQ